MHARSKTKHAHMLDDFGPTQPKVSVNITLAAHANKFQNWSVFIFLVHRSAVDS
jgi:hypothetical protein